MQPLTIKTVKKLQRETGRKLVAEDCDLVEELDKIADKIGGVSKVERRLLNQPYELCGLLFYPLTVAKSLWYAEKCEEWEVEGVNQDAFLFWLLTLPNSSYELDQYSTRKQANKAVKRLSIKLHCTQSELMGVYHKCLGISGESSGKGGESDTDYGGMVAVLLREYGGTPDKWLYETPIEMISALFKAYSDKVNAESAGSNTKGKAPQWNEKMQNLKDFRLKVNEITELWRGE